jgi:HEAT repeat protein
MTMRRAGWWSLVVLLAASVAAAQEWDRKTIDKMLKDGTKKLTSAKAEEREEGAGYILGYITCADRPQYQPVLLRALKDSSPNVRERAVQSLEKIQAVDAIPQLLAMLEDPESDVRVRAAYAIGGMGVAAKGAEPELKKAQARAAAQKDSMLEGSLENALDEVSGRRAPDRYKCP